MKIGDLVRIKEQYAFDVVSHYHYGEVIEVDTNCIEEETIRLKSDLRYTHDSIIWIESKYYDCIGNIKNN